MIISFGMSRVLFDDSCAAWTSWAKFCFRCGYVDKGEECVRQALIRDPGDVPALVTLACICWRKSGSADQLYMDDAVAVRDTLDLCIDARKCVCIKHSSKNLCSSRMKP